MDRLKYKLMRLHVVLFMMLYHIRPILSKSILKATEIRIFNDFAKQPKTTSIHNPNKSPRIDEGLTRQKNEPFNEVIAFGLSSNDIELPEILKDPSAYTDIYNNMVGTLDNNVQYYYRNYMHQYSIKFSSAYGLTWYYYYDLLYDKIKWFFPKYEEYN